MVGHLNHVVKQNIKTVENDIKTIKEIKNNFNFCTNWSSSNKQSNEDKKADLIDCDMYNEPKQEEEQEKHT